MEKKDMIKAINDSPLKIYMAITGGGTGFIGDFLKFGGGSQTILGYEVPYHPVAFDNFVGQKMTKYCNEEAANALAKTAFYNALNICQTGNIHVKLDEIVGIGVTASLTKGVNEREGRWNGAYVTRYKGTKAVDFKIDFTEGNRQHQEQALVEFILTKIYNLID